MIIDIREIGQYPCSIGTSLAIEGVSGVYPDRAEQDDRLVKSPPRQLWVNILTVIRNCLNAVRREHRSQLTPAVLHELVVSDLNGLDSTIRQLTQGLCIPVYYYCDYTGIQRKYPKANYRIISTPLQQNQRQLETGCLGLLRNGDCPVDVRSFSLDITGQHPETWIMTHYPLDLLNRYRFGQLTLLESHTGILKPPSQWYTKLHHAKTVDYMPFNHVTLQLFGDAHMFLGFSPRLRGRVIELAQGEGWSSMTSLSRMRSSIRKLDADEIAVIMTLF